MILPPLVFPDYLDEICKGWFIFTTIVPKKMFTLSFLGNLRMDPKDIVLHYIRLEGLAMDKHSSLLGIFVSCEKNDVL
jgi:hypothetical protein